MLNLKRVRIGNWVSFENNPYRIAEISGDETIGIVRENGATIETRFVPISCLSEIDFTKEVLRNLEGYCPKDHEETSNLYLVSLQGNLDPSGLEVEWSLCFKQLEGSWWVTIEESSITFEVVGEGEFFYLHDLQNIVSTFTDFDLVWKI